MNRKIIATLAAGCALLAVSGCGTSKAEPAATVTKTTTPSASATPVTTVSGVNESVPKNDPDAPDNGDTVATSSGKSASGVYDSSVNDFKVLKFGEAFAVPGTKVVWKSSAPKTITDDPAGVENYGDTAKTVQQIDFTITNNSKTVYEIAESSNDYLGDYDGYCYSDFQDAEGDNNTNPTRVAVGHTVTYSMRCGANTKGQFAMDVAADGFSDPWATISNDPTYAAGAGDR